jgi:hypothetical protein
MTTPAARAWNSMCAAVDHEPIGGPEAPIFSVADYGLEAVQSRLALRQTVRARLCQPSRDGKKRL